MRLHSILLESSATTLLKAPAVIDGATVKTLASLIAEAAGPWMAATDGGHRFFYRGAAQPPDHALAFIKPLRDDRVGLHTDDDVHEALNAMIIAIGGMATRSNAVAVTANQSDSTQYGLPYVAIPLGDFSYTWSPLWQDWFQFSGNHNTLSHIVTFLRPDVAEEFFDEPEEAERIYRYQIDSLKHRYKNETDPMKRAALKVQINYKERPDARAEFFGAYVMDMGHDYTMNILKNPRNYDVNALHKLIIADRGLTNAHSKHHEVMVRCDRMLYIVPELYELVLKVYHGEMPSEQDLARYATLIRREWWPEVYSKKETL